MNALPDYLIQKRREVLLEKAKRKQELETPTLYDAQQRFMACLAHYVAFVGGIGSGKTYTGCIRALKAAYGQIGDKATAIPTPNLGAITAPTYPMLRDVTIRTFFELADKHIVSFNKSEAVATLKNGSQILFRSTEHPDRLRGANLSWWFGDEAALYTPDVWRIMIGRLRQHGINGYAWLATTPKGRNWIYQEFVQQVRADYEIFKAKTSENIYLAPEFVENLRTSYVGDFAAQELDGEFVAFEGLIYPEFDRALHITNRDLDKQYTRVVCGVDWGFANPGVMLVIGVDGDGRATLLQEHYKRQRHIDDWVTVAKQIRSQYTVSAWYCDPSEPDYIKKLRDAGLNAVQANNTVTTGIQVVKARLIRQADGKPRLLLRPDAVNIAAEFEQYVWAENRYGVRDEPLKSNDHALDALRYALMGLDYGMKPIEVKTSSYIG